METQTLPNFIVVDDDPINNNICRKLIQTLLPEVGIETFTDPETGLGYMRSTYIAPGANNAILFLDINMPTLTGWEVLEEFENFPDLVKQHIKIYMLSSSVDPSDKQK